MTLIGLCGKMGCGKDYIATKYIIPYLQKQLGKQCLHLCFADQLKVNAMCKNNLKYDDLYIKKTDYSRALLQKEGTEYGRNILGQDIWIKYIKNWVQVFSNRGFQHFVITDVRFKNEIDFIKSQNGIVIKIVAPKRTDMRLMQESKGDINVYNSIKQHESESEIDTISNSVYDMIINNDTNDNSCILGNLEILGLLLGSD